jgi:O-antigen/teichoic acid export membrane protein
MATATNIPGKQEITPALVPPRAGGNEFQQRIGSISRQSAVYFAGTILTAAAGCFFKIYLARRLGAEALGLYALGMSIVGFLGLFNAVGLPTAAARFVAEYSARGEFARLGGFLRAGLALLSLGNLLLGGLVMVAGPWVAVHFYHAPALRSYFWAFALIMLLGAFTTFLGQVMAGYRDVARRTIITHFIGTPANIAVAVLLISLGFGLRGYMIAQVVSAMLVLGLLAAAVWRMTPLQARAGRAWVPVERKVVAFSAAAFGLAGVDFALSQTDKIVLGHYLAAKQVGIYAVAMALVGFVPIALQSVNQIFSPIIAELHVLGNRVLLQKLYTTLTKWIVVSTIPLALTIVIFARPVMGVFGAGFQSGAAVLAIGAIGQLINCAVGSVGFLLMMSGHQIEMIKIQAVNAALMIGLSIYLVPRMGMSGAALASAITVATTNLWSLAAVRRRLKLFPYDAGYLKLALPALVSGGLLMGLSRAATGGHSMWKIAIFALACAYASFLAVLLIFGLDGEDREIAQMVWAKITHQQRRNRVRA